MPVLTYADDANLRRNSLVTELTEKDLARLYVWLHRHFPPEGDPDVEGVHRVTPRESVRDVRGQLFNHLVAKGSPAALDALRYVAEELPEETWIQQGQVRAETRLLEESWAPPNPTDVLRLLDDPERRRIESADQLVEVIVTSLRRLEEELQGETPSAPELWDNKEEDRRKTPRWQPKGELYLSDKIKRHLARDLGPRGIVVGRETEFRRGEKPGGRGEYTDILVHAVAPGRSGERNVIRVVVEVKGCFNPKVETDIRDQLRDRYLADNDCTHGLYVVGWYGCAQWDTTDNASRAKWSKRPREELDEFLSACAGELSDEDRKLCAFVLNAALR